MARILLVGPDGQSASERDGASICLLSLLCFNPRLFLGHYPKAIRQIVPPRSKRERRTSILLGLLIGVPFASAFALANCDFGKSLLLGALRLRPRRAFHLQP